MFAYHLPKDRGSFSTHTIQMQPKSELRINYNFTEFVFIKLLQGHAEVLGQELPKQLFRLPNNRKSINVYTYQGATLELYKLELLQTVSFY